MLIVEMDKICEFDPKLKTFLNVNTLEDIEKYNI